MSKPTEDYECITGKAHHFGVEICSDRSRRWGKPEAGGVVELVKDGRS